MQKIGSRDLSQSLCNVKCSAQYNVAICVLESESDSVSESVSVNVNEPQELLVICIFTIFTRPCFSVIYENG